MAEITASLVKELRERTGVGMMECKKALVASQGDIEKAIEEMRKAGVAKAAKKAGRTTAEGAVVVVNRADSKEAVMIEINCETDFVARDENFVSFANHVAKAALQQQTADIDSISAISVAGQTIEEQRQGLIAKLGENIALRRCVLLASSGLIASYRHGDRIGVLVAMEGGDMEVARDIAMHIAANNPEAISPEDIPAELIEKEKDIFRAQAMESGKPADIVEKMIVGRVNKFLSENSLLGQPFVKNPEITVAKLLQEKSAKVVDFVRFEVGEGIEKRVDNFAEEVMAQVKGS